MIAAWMIYGCLVALCLGVAASAAEHLIRVYGKPARAVWVIALAGSLLVPLVNWAVVTRADAVTDGVQATPVLPVIATSLLSSPLQVYAPASPVLLGLDSMLVVIWLGMSLALVALGTASLWRISRERRNWRAATIEGKRILVSDHVGPAVIGLLNHEVVVPDWLLGLSAGMRRAALRHEQEHVRAGDLRLAMLASLTVLLFPWNISLWWQLRRLRTALEADCDARVLSQGGDLRTYGALLLEVGSRAWYPRLATLALIERKSSLVRRIEIMTLRPRLRIAQACGAVVLAGAFALLACETPVPSQLGDEQGALTQVDGAYPETAVDSQPQRLSSPPLEYPKLLAEAGIEGYVLLQGVVGVDGRIEPGSVEILESTNAAFDLPSRRLLEGSRFRPGKIDGQAVRTLIQLPIQFTLIGKPDEETPDPPKDGVGVTGVERYMSLHIHIRTAPVPDVEGTA